MVLVHTSTERKKNKEDRRLIPLRVFPESLAFPEHVVDVGGVELRL